MISEIQIPVTVHFDVFVLTFVIQLSAMIGELEEASVLMSFIFQPSVGYLRGQCLPYQVKRSIAITV